LNPVGSQFLRVGWFFFSQSQVRRFTVHMTEGARPARGGRWHAAEEAVSSEGSDFFFFSTVFAPLRRFKREDSGFLQICFVYCRRSKIMGRNSPYFNIS
jgi:hypothetical protein